MGEMHESPRHFKVAIMTELKKYDLVKYVPGHAFGDQSHNDCELGIVSEVSIGGGLVFVRFEKHIRQFGFDGATGQACSPDSLVFVERGWDTDAERNELLSTRKKGWVDGGLLDRDWLLLNCDRIHHHRWIKDDGTLYCSDSACFEIEANGKDDRTELRVTLHGRHQSMSERLLKVDIELWQIGETGSQSMLLGFFREQSSLRRLIAVLMEGVA